MTEFPSRHRQYSIATEGELAVGDQKFAFKLYIFFISLLQTFGNTDSGI